MYGGRVNDGVEISGRVLVTGGTGFLGRRLVDELICRNVSVAVLTRHERLLPSQWARSGVDVRVADLLQPQTLSGICQGVDTVFHLASHAEELTARHTDSPNMHQRLTIDGTRSLLDEAVRARVRGFVFVSSVKVMGETTSDCVDETHGPRPVTDYGAAKLAAEALLRDVAVRTGLHGCILRLPLVYGPNPKGNLTRMIAAIDRGRFPSLPDSRNARSMVHVDDVVRALLLAASAPVAKGQTYIVTDGRAYSTREIYEAICKSLDRPIPKWRIPVVVLRMAGIGGDLVVRMSGKVPVVTSAAVQKLLGSACYRCDKIRHELNYEPSRDLYSAIPEMVQAYRAWRDDQNMGDAKKGEGAVF